MESAIWCRTPAAASAARRLRPEVSKNSSTALSKRRRVGEVDHHLRAGHGLFEALAGDGVDAGIGRGSDDLVAALTQNGDGLRADQASTADNYDLHSELVRSPQAGVCDGGAASCRQASVALVSCQST